ncbi:chemotaxis-specific protein-glutamate methyltransferase CheB [Andreprevotia chitinilytica]|uniref:chemotaxis-specific protein-glutamate methyltransferase CheB n=1 Tax=Andreprevotia chitinilytica TaxID=396808 RepID=UPI0006900B67|nr:chemotaxis-specific protein-glutamate methyltransferase CheB [Andreprevotia chitinilytica]
MPTKVLIIDHSPIARLAMSDSLKAVSEFVVVGLAGEPHAARSLFRSQQPDVVVIDTDIPGLDCVALLRALQSERKTPAVAIASQTDRSSKLALQMMEHGAVAVVNRASLMMRQIQDNSANLVQAVRAAAQSRGGHRGMPQIGAMRPPPPPPPAPITARATTPITPSGQIRSGYVAPPSAPAPAPRPATTNASVSVINERMSGPKLSPDMLLPAPTRNGVAQLTGPVIAIGASTGGVQALEAILPHLPANSPPIIIVQHMPENFTANFAARLNSLSKIEVRQATNNERLRPGVALIAPGGKHMLLKRNGAQYHVEIIDGPLITRHRPSVDVLFRSTANAAGQNGIGFLLTGMGDDGAKCLRELHEVGGTTYAQDEKTCTVFGMPREAIRLGGVTNVVSLHDVPRLIASYARGTPSAAPSTTSAISPSSTGTSSHRLASGK